MGDTPPCPFCAEPIKTAAVIGRFCNSRLDRTAETHSTLDIPVLGVSAKGFPFDRKEPLGWRRRRSRGNAPLPPQA